MAKKTESNKIEPKKKDSEEVVLVADNLFKEFNSASGVTEVIKGISCSFKQGEFVSIMGPSGAGKSVLLYLLSGIENLTKGQVKILGKDINKLNERELSKLRSTDISFVFQSYNLIPNFTVYENIITPLLLAKKKVNEEEVDRILKSVDLFRYKHKESTKLSGGEQQRVAIARALISKPKIMFADEATGNLDSKNSMEIMKLFKKVNKETNVTIIQVTHSKEVAMYGDRLIIIKDGLILSDKKIDKNKPLNFEI